MKNLIVASLVILSVNVSHAQTKLGLRLNPGVSTQRISYTNDNFSIGNGSNAFNLSAMLFADFEMSSNYFFNTGMGYTSKRININYQRQGEPNSYNKSYNIQYVQIPATLTLFTNEIALDKKLFFQFGPLMEIAIHNKESNAELRIIEQFKPVDISLLFTTGMQLQLAPQTAMQIGFSYSRGLINVVKSSAEGIGNLTIKNDIYALDLSLKF
jgi:hypothetical protein